MRKNIICLQAYMNKVEIILLPESDEVEDLAKLYVKEKILSKKSFDDCQHIAFACVYNCDMIVSWNFKHIVNYKTYLWDKKCKCNRRIPRNGYLYPDNDY